MSTPVEEKLSELALADARQSLTEKGKQRGIAGEGTAFEEGFHVPEGEVDETTCAICLNKIPLPESAQPEECEHLYCACCILHWAVYKEKPWCPQCKAPFNSLLTFRALDGSLRDFPSRESVCLLKRACWFQEHVKMREQAIAEATALRPLSGSRIGRFLEGSVIDESDYGDYAGYYDEYDDDEEVENYYFSAAAGRARVVIGNRRHGPNGFIASGRQHARPSPTPLAPKVKQPSDAEGSPSGSFLPRKQPSKPQSKHATPKGRNSSSGDIETDLDSGSCSSKKQSAGRRARRNQRRAAADAKAGL